MDARIDERLRETVFRGVTRSGLGVTVLPKPGFHKTEVHLAVGFGSIDEDGAVGTGDAFPRGTAHFLEHMLFENAENDPTAAFARLGAQVNAYTAADVTDYYFSTTESWLPAAELLFPLVLHPRFPEEAVAKEREIIAREIQMYEDFLNALYRANPVRNPIAGTKDSIAAVDALVLARAHARYYVPANMKLLVVGDVDPEEVFAASDRNPSFPLETKAPTRNRMPEDHRPARTRIVKTRDLMNDMVMLGVKFDRPTAATPFENDIEEILWSFLFDALFAKSSANHQRLVKLGYINEGFEASAQCEPDYGHLAIYTESKKPEAAAKALWELLDSAKNHLDGSRFEIAKRRLVGNYVQAFDSISALAGLFLDFELEGVDTFRLIAAVDALTLDDVHGLLPKLQTDARVIVSYRRKKK
jgi:predicted Zn-dependent peptidase